MSNKRIFKHEIDELTDRQLQETIAYKTSLSEQHLRRISNNVVFIVWIIILSFIVTAAMIVLGSNTRTL